MMRALAACNVGCSIAVLVSACAAPPATQQSIEPGAPTVIAAEAEPTPIASPEPSPQSVVRLAGGIEVDRAEGEVRVPATVASTRGWLEQVVCLVETREHESLLVVEVKPSQIHAALLLLGLEAGEPGRWRYENGQVEVDPSHGPEVVPLVRWREGETEQTTALADWIRGADGRAFPAKWVFAGSHIRPNPPSWGAGEHYQADFSGSVVGLVTFGDETVAASTVISDETALESANWESWTERMPSEGTRATLILQLPRSLRPSLSPAATR